MALPAREQVRYWASATAVFLAVLWVLGDAILPFVNRTDRAVARW